MKFSTFDTRLREAVGSVNRALDISRMRLAQEDRGWAPWGKIGYDEEISLEVVRTHSERARNLAVLNPMVRHGIVVRNGYMWNDGARYVGLKPAAERVIERNQEEAFSDLARARDEESFNTDGCVIYLVDRQAKKVYNLTLSRLQAVARHPITNEPMALLLQGKAQPEPGEKPMWYLIDGVEQVSKIDDDSHATHQTIRCVYETVNRRAGETLGKPDLIGALYYANAYKEYLEAAHQMSVALARIAYKVTSVNGRQQQAVQTKMGTSGVGATASLGAGQDITAVNKAGAGIEFSSGTPLAAMVAAALDIPLSVLLTDGSAGGRQGAEAVLEEPTFKSLDLRRKVHHRLVLKLYKALGINGEFRFGALNADQVHRRIQALSLAHEGGAIHDEEYRSGVLQVIQVPDAKPVEELPPKPEPVAQQTQDDAGGEEKKDGRSTGVGPLSDGTNDNRDKATDA